MIKKVIGLIFISIGILWLLSNLKIASFDDPSGIVFALGLVYIGIVGIFEQRKINFMMMLLVVLGIFLFLTNTNIIDRNIMVRMLEPVIWPVIIIVVGIALLFSMTKKHVTTKPIATYNAIFAGIEETNESSEFVSSEITTVFGGAEVDYRKIKIKEDKAYIVVTCIFGGATIFIPEDVKVTVKGLPIFGGAENKAASKENSKKELIINYTAVFGGVEIKN